MSDEANAPFGGVAGSGTGSRFGGDTNQAAQFARSVPDFVLKGRFADLVKLDLQALEQEMGFAVGPARAWWRRLIRG